MRGFADGSRVIRLLLKMLLMVAACHGSVPNSAPRAQVAVPSVRIGEGSFVRIGGIEQWITIKGEDKSKPVVLFLHGGPGDALSPFADAMFAGWEKDFVLVQWDQRGAGRTFAKNGAAVEPTMTIQRMVDDGIEVTEYLLRHLRKRRVVLVGSSWGSMLGVYMAHERPDLFYAYVGVAQMVNWQENLAASYARVLEMARAAGDRQGIEALMGIGPPPWHTVKNWPVFHGLERSYQAKVITAPAAAAIVGPGYDSPEERAQYEAADDFSFVHFWGVKLDGPLTEVDLPALGTEFAIPVFIIQGENDLTALPELARSYFDSIQAPRKRFYLAPGTGHEESATELEMIHKVLVEQVGPHK